MIQFRYLVLTLILCSSCKSISHRQLDHLSRFETLKMGVTKQEVIKIFGSPAIIERDGEDSRMTYMVQGRLQPIPKIIVWLNKMGFVVAKTINLFHETGDALTKTQFEKRYSNSKFELESSKIPDQAHYIPSEKYLVDREQGIVAEYQPGEGSISYIHWSTRVLKNGVASAKED